MKNHSTSTNGKWVRLLLGDDFWNRKKIFGLEFFPDLHWVGWTQKIDFKGRLRSIFKGICEKGKIYNFKIKFFKVFSCALIIVIFGLFIHYQTQLDVNFQNLEKNFEFDPLGPPKRLKLCFSHIVKLAPMPWQHFKNLP